MQYAESLESMMSAEFVFKRISIVIPPTGKYCREDRCQSFFDFQLVPSVRQPMEECEAAGALKAIGVPAQVVDAPTLGLSEELCLEKILSFAPDLIVVVATFGTLDQDLQWARKIKAKLPNVKIGLRGAPAYVLAESILTGCAELDFCIRGEYELVFQSLARSGIESTPGLMCNTLQGVESTGKFLYAEDLDELPFSDRSVIDQNQYRVRILGKPQATIRVQRGCPYPCSYCLVHTVNGDKARHRSPENIVSEIKQIQESGLANFYFRADTFSVDRDWALGLVKLLARECPGIRWVTTTRVERVDLELLQAMHRAGCYGVSFGVDVASQQIGKLVNKKPDLERATLAMRLCDQVGLISLAYLMIGFVWENEFTLKETASFAKMIRPDLLTIHFAHPYPGTKYYQDYLNSGLVLKSNKAQAAPVGDSLALNDQQLRSAGRNMLLRHYSRPAVLYSLTKKLSRMFRAR